MVNLQTGRLIIRNFLVEDWEALREIIIDKEASEYAVYDYPLPTSDDEIKHVTEMFASSGNYLAIFHIAAEKIIGFVSLTGTDAGEMDLGFCIHSRFQCMGYAAEACSSVIDYAFSVLGVERLTSGTANQNFPSCKLLKKLGFKKVFEGTASFRKTSDGIPIEFVGSLFQLEKKNWSLKVPLL